MWEEMGGSQYLENPQGIRMEASGCGGGIRWGKGKRLAAGWGQLGLKEQSILMVGAKVLLPLLQAFCHCLR